MGDDEPTTDTSSAEHTRETTGSPWLAQMSSASSLTWGLLLLAGGAPLGLFGIISEQNAVATIGVLAAVAGVGLLAVGLHALASKVDAIYRFHAVGTMVPESPEPPPKMNGFAD